MMCLCWSSNLLVHTGLMKRNTAASQGHFKKDNSPDQNMLGLDWECWTLQKQVCWQTSLPIIFHAMSYKEWGVTAGGGFLSSAQQVQLPAGHAVILWWSWVWGLCCASLGSNPFPVGGRSRTRLGKVCLLLQAAWPSHCKLNSKKENSPVTEEQFFSLWRVKFSWTCLLLKVA